MQLVATAIRAQVSLVDASRGSKLGHCHWAMRMQGFVQPERVANPN